jgi:hypothetical protein
LSDVRVIGDDVAFCNRYASLAGSHLDSVVGDAEADCEAEGGAKPVGRCAGVGIFEDRNDGARRYGTVEKHGDTLTGLETFWGAGRAGRRHTISDISVVLEMEYSG